MTPGASGKHKGLYRTTGPVPEGEYAIPLGQAAVARVGKDVTIVAWSRMVLEALRAAEGLANEGIATEVIDLRSLRPLDDETVFASVRKTNRAVVVQEAWRTAFGAEVVNRIQESCFDDLDVSVLWVTGPDAHIPFSPALEKGVIPKAPEIAAAVRQSLRRA